MYDEAASSADSGDNINEENQNNDANIDGSSTSRLDTTTVLFSSETVKVQEYTQDTDDDGMLILPTQQFSDYTGSLFPPVSENAGNGDLEEDNNWVCHNPFDNKSP